MRVLLLQVRKFVHGRTGFHFLDGTQDQDHGGRAGHQARPDGTKEKGPQIGVTVGRAGNVTTNPTWLEQTTADTDAARHQTGVA